jgi:hypothetical protein
LIIDYLPLTIEKMALVGVGIGNVRYSGVGMGNVIDTDTQNDTDTV